MAWEWSHTQEAYDNGKANLYNMDREDLDIVYAEWIAADGAHIEAVADWKVEAIEEEGENWEQYWPPAPDWDSNGFDETAYNAALKVARTLDTDVLVEYIWERASEYRTCDNGGFNLWVCSHGCHTVSCDLESEECA